MFLLRDGCPPQFIDPAGRMRSISRRRQTIGRHPESDIVVDRGYNDVSRAHLLIEWTGGTVVQLIDVSSRGTSVEMSSSPG